MIKKPVQSSVSMIDLSLHVFAGYLLVKRGKEKFLFCLHSSISTNSLFFDMILKKI